MSAPRTVVITGGSFGFGLAMAAHFLAGGDRVWVCGRTASTLADAVAELPTLRAVQADVSVAADRERFLDTVTRVGEGLDIFINNAAIVKAQDYTNDFTLGTDRAAGEIAINFVAPIELTRMFLAWRRQNGLDDTPASIVNVSTPGALFPLEANMMYSTTKAGFHMFTLALRRQLRHTPVKVLEVFPPGLDTGLSRDLDVPHQRANGPDVIEAVALATVEAINRGDEVILPHPDSVRMYDVFSPKLDGEFLDQINARVGRRPGWDQP